MTPRQAPMSPVLTFDPDQRGRSGNKRKRGNLAQRRLHVALDGRVGREHHWHGLPLFTAALQDGGNADVVLAQDAGQLREDPGPVQHHEPQVVEAADLRDRADAQRPPLVWLEGARRHAPHRPLENVAGDVDDVAHYGAGGRGASRSLSLEHYDSPGVSRQLRSLLYPADPRD